MKKNYVIIRSDIAGVFFGELVSESPLGDKLMVVLKNARCLWRWSGCSLLQVSQDGYNDLNYCKFTVTVSEIKIMGVVETIPCTEKSIEKIKSVTEWKL